ncbi:MAG TPA: hypothetical protein VII58_07240 [Acidobacteriaceae bacterium]
MNERTKATVWMRAALGVCVWTVLAGVADAERCTTQSAMTPADRSALADAARSVALKVQADDTAGLRSTLTPELTRDAAAFEYLAGSTSTKLAGSTAVVEQVYLLDASDLKKNADGSPAEAQFFCSLNKTTAEVQFSIPALPPGRYGFALVTFASAKPWRLSLLMRQEGGRWLLAGFYPSAMTAAGHDGMWYWTEARQMAKSKQQWVAWLYYQEAERLLSPAEFVMTTHLDKLRTEAGGAAPSVLSEGISTDSPLVVKAADGTEYRFTVLGVDDSLGQASVDVAAHYKADSIADPVAARKRNDAAAAALVAAYPELRKPFHGVWVFAESAGKPPFATEAPMGEIK